MEISSLPLSPSLRSKLLSAGYTNLCSLSSISAPELARALNVSNHEAAGVLKVVLQRSRVDGAGESHAIINGAQTAWDIFRDEQTLTRVTTSCEELDTILGGGINCKEVTEIGGVPGIGKTQLGIQLAINVQIPVDYGGLGGKAIYIDTEGSFMVERVFQIAEACIQDTLDNFSLKHKDFQVCEEKMQPKAFLANIFYFRICSYTEQIAVINYLDKFIAEQQNDPVKSVVDPFLLDIELIFFPLFRENPRVEVTGWFDLVKLVVIDSVTFHFRQDFEDLALRTRVLSGMALKLMKLAKKFSLAVVLLNQVTTKFIDGSFQLTLALGDSWSHACTNRVILYWNGNERYAYIDKSPSLQSASASFSVTSKGIRSATSNSKRIKIM